MSEQFAGERQACLCEEVQLGGVTGLRGAVL
jgi:hypothetical protein